MDLKQIDITIIINCHREYGLILPTLVSAHTARHYAEKRGLSLETIVVADAPDEKMINLLYEQQKDHVLLIDHIFVTSHSDLGAARNTGVREARGTYIAFLDGDDLFGPSWPHKAFEFLKNKPNSIAHPEVCFFFGSDPHWWRHIDSESKIFRSRELITHNYWSALSFARKDTYLTLPYIPCDSKGYGFEDWHWNCETLNAGFTHVVVPETIHAIRIKLSGSMNSRFRKTRALLAPTLFFKNKKWMMQKERSSIQLKFYALIAKLLMLLHRYPVLAGIASKAPLLSFPLPEWARKEVDVLNKIESSLSEAIKSSSFRFYQYKNSALAKKYPELLNQVLHRDNSHDSFLLTSNPGHNKFPNENYLIFCISKSKKLNNVIDLSHLRRKDRFFIFSRLCLDFSTKKIILDGPMNEFLELYGENLSKTKVIEMIIRTQQQCSPELANLDPFITTYQVANAEIRDLMTSRFHIYNKKIKIL